MKTQLEIVARIQERYLEDFLLCETKVYLEYIDFERAKPILAEISPDITGEGWQVRDQAHILKDMEEYMSYAWQKANDRRGIGITKCINHYAAWIWLLGDSAFAEEVDRELNENYRFYGKEILILICNKYGWDYSQYDDGIRTND